MDRKQKIIFLRKVGKTYQQIAKEFGVSRQRIYQICNNNIYYTPSYKRNAKCLFCSSNKHIEWHHTDSDRNNNRRQNLIPLCKSCHKELHIRLKAYKKLLGIIFSKAPKEISRLFSISFVQKKVLPNPTINKPSK